VKVKVLGCSGAEFPGHHLPGFLLDDRILFDAGSLTTALNWKAQQRIEKIFVTHAHLDHMRGILFLADNLIVGNVERQVKVLSVPPVLRTIKQHLLNSAVWPDFTVIPTFHGAVLSLVGLERGQPYRTGDYAITPFNVDHSVPAVGYLVEDGQGRRLFYTGDTGRTDATWKRLRKKPVHALIIEVAFPNRMGEKAILAKHLTPRLLEDEVAKIIPPPEKIYINHVKPQYFNTIRRELGRLKLRNLHLLHDGETIRI